MLISILILGTLTLTETLITANAALYGFVVAYYIFARMLHRQHEWRIKDHYPPEGQTAHIQKLRLLRILLNGFLIVTTLAFGLSNLSYLAFIGDPSAEVLYIWGNRFSFVLFSAVSGWFLFLGVANLSDTLREYREGRK